jgi:putative endonuclease
MENIYYTYIITNIRNTVFYTGITNNLQRRTQEHREKKIIGFTSRYNVSKLVWYETFPTPQEAIAAEKKIKGWGRRKKLAMIIKINPLFKDLDVLDSSTSSE